MIIKSILLLLFILQLLLMKNLLINLQGQRGKLRVELQKLQEKMRQLTDENKLQEDKLRQLEKENRKQLAIIEELSKDNADLRKRMEQINTDSEGKNNEIGRLKAKIDEQMEWQVNRGTLYN